MNDPVITIAGRAWRIPFLAPRQNRIVILAIIGLGAQSEGRYAALLDMVFAALTRAYPQLNRDEFENWPIPTRELIEALPVISAQTGVLKPAREKSTTPLEPPDWDAIIAQFCNFLPGTTPDYWEDALTAPRLEAMREEWRKHPPLAALAAGWLNYKPAPRDADAVEELMRLFPNGRLAAASTLH